MDIFYAEIDSVEGLEDKIKFTYKKGSFNKKNWTSCVFNAKNIGKTNINDSFFHIYDHKNACIFNLDFLNSRLESVKNYDDFSETVDIHNGNVWKFNEEKLIRITFHNQYYMNLYAISFILLIEDVNKNYWKQNINFNSNIDVNNSKRIDDVTFNNFSSVENHIKYWNNKLELYHGCLKSPIH